MSTRSFLGIFAIAALAQSAASPSIAAQAKPAKRGKPKAAKAVDAPARSVGQHEGGQHEGGQHEGGQHEGRQREWRQWRGPEGTGHARFAKPPTTWSESKNLAWKVEVPGRGYGSPIVSRGHVYIATAVAVGHEGDAVPDDAPGAHDNARVTRRHRFELLAFKAATGELAWRRVLHEQKPHEAFHKMSALVAASPCTDGERIYAFFGSYGLYCVGRDSKLLWKRDLGDMKVKHGHGEGASPVLTRNAIVVNWDHRGDDFLVALDKKSGEELWRTAREEPTSWSSPIVVEVDGRELIIVSATGGVRAYAAADGRQVWSCRGMSNNVVASPVAGGGIVYAGSSYVRKRMMAIRLEGARGDLTPSEHVLWRRGARTPYVPSPLLVDGWLYFLTHYQGFLSRVHGASGREAVRPLRLPEIYEIYASPVAANGHVYVTGRAGATVVLRHAPGPKGEARMRILRRNELEDGFSASPAIAGDALYLRGHRFLYCIREAEQKAREPKTSAPESSRRSKDGQP